MGVKFSPGDKVWPIEGPSILQDAPQVVIAVHADQVTWLWLRDKTGTLRTHIGQYWTTEEPDDAEKVARFARRRENEELRERRNWW